MHTFERGVNAERDPNARGERMPTRMPMQAGRLPDRTPSQAGRMPTRMPSQAKRSSCPTPGAGRHPPRCLMHGYSMQDMNALNI